VGPRAPTSHRPARLQRRSAMTVQTAVGDPRRRTGRDAVVVATTDLERRPATRNPLCLLGDDVSPERGRKISARTRWRNPPAITEARCSGPCVRDRSRHCHRIQRSCIDQRAASSSQHQAADTEQQALVTDDVEHAGQVGAVRRRPGRLPTGRAAARGSRSSTCGSASNPGRTPLGPT